MTLEQWLEYLYRGADMSEFVKIGAIVIFVLVILYAVFGAVAMLAIAGVSYYSRRRESDRR